MKNETINSRNTVCVAGFDITDFLNSLKTDGRSKQTRNAYQHDLSQFSRYLDKTFGVAGKKIRDISFADLQGWIGSISDLSPASIARKKSTLKTFFRYLKNIEVIAKNPAEKLNPTKIPKKVPRVISQENARDLLSYFRNENDTFNSKRNYAIVAVLLYTGVRCQELTDIKLSDIVNWESVENEESYIVIKGKGSKERKVSISRQLQPILADYIQNQRDKCGYALKSNYLFVSQKSEKMSTYAVEDVVNKGLEKSKIERFPGIDRSTSGKKVKGLSVHVLRKRFATTLFQRTGSIAAVADALGHSDIRVTMSYIGIDNDQTRRGLDCLDFI